MRLYNLLTGRSVEIDTGNLLGAGGEGRVFAVAGDSRFAAKIYDQAHDPRREPKLRAMVTNPPDSPNPGVHSSIAWPVDLLAERPHGPVVGYIMPRVRNARVIDDYYNPAARREHCPLFHYGYLLTVARNLASAVRVLHQRGFVVGDVKQSNILVTANALVTLVDTDSFQVRDEMSDTVYRCPVGTPEYTPPEFQNLTAPEILTPEHDLFGLAVLVFQLLMEGAHPFAGAYTGDDDPPPIGERILRGWFPYFSDADTVQPATFRRQQEIQARTPPPFTPTRRGVPFSILPAQLQAMFLSSFVEGRTNPERRPTAEAWLSALDAARADVICCRANNQHRYGNHLESCPWCERRHNVLRGRDPFPAADAIAASPPAPAPHFDLTSRQFEPLPYLNVQHAWSGNRRPQSGWPAYAVAALGIPLMLCLASNVEFGRVSRQSHAGRSHNIRLSPLAAGAEEGAPAQMLAPSLSARGAQDIVAAQFAQPCLSLDGRYALAQSGPDRISLFDTTRGAEVYLAQRSNGMPIGSMAVSPDGRLFAAADRLGVTIHDRVKTSARTVLPNCGEVRAMAFSPVSQALAIARQKGDSLVTLVNPVTGNVLERFIGDYGEMVTGLYFSPLGTRLYALTVGSGAGTTLYCWNSASGGLIWRHNDPQWTGGMAISPANDMLALGGDQLQMRDWADFRVVDSYIFNSASSQDLQPLAFEPNGHMLAVTIGGTVKLMRLRSEGNWDSDQESLPIVGATAAAFSKDASRLTVVYQSEVDVWDTERHEVIRRLRF